MMQKALLVVVVAFLGFWLWTDPHGLATTAKSAGSHGASGAAGLFSHVISFAKDL